jgi:hypothetical protein
VLSLKINRLIYLVAPVSIILFGLFIYPTVYEFDKLDQKYPVKINRLTGNASILTGNGWVSSSDYDKANETMLEYKREIEEKISNQSDEISKSIIAEITDDIIFDVESQLDIVKSEIEEYKNFETDPDNYFTTGDTADTVRGIMGVPSSIIKSDYFNKETWFYGISTVSFENGKVKEWSNTSGVLKIK